MKVPLLSLVATETEELKKNHRKENYCMYTSTSFTSVAQCRLFLKMDSYSRHNLCVVDQVLQRVAAGEVIVEVCGVADQPLVRSGCVDVACDDN